MLNTLIKNVSNMLQEVKNIFELKSHNKVLGHLYFIYANLLKPDNLLIFKYLIKYYH